MSTIPPQKPIIAILGPTASGKSSLSLEVALKFSGEIVNCDSRQIYKHMNIGTSKPDNKDLAVVHHHLFDIVEPTKQFSAGDYSKLASDKIREIWVAGKLPILVGGTGFYFSSLFDGISEVGKDDKVTAEVMSLYKAKGLSGLLAELNRLDVNAYHSIDKNNLRRVLRALEVIKISGKPFSEAKAISPIPEGKFLPIPVTRPRKILHFLIEKRVDIMLKLGLEKEVRELVEKYGAEAHALGAIGYSEWFDYFNKKVSLNEVREKIIIHTRQYAKRQDTWFRKRPGNAVIDISSEGATENIFDTIELFLR